MGIMVGLPSPSGSEKDLQLNFGKNMTVQVEMRVPHLPAEWHMQSGIQLTWPHAGTDWAYMLAEVQECFINIAREIAKRELLLIVTPEPEEVKKQIAATVNMNNVRFLECATNDTWARDHGAITMIDTGTPSLLDFTFNGWGLKFASELDNQITKQAVEAGALKGQYIDRLDFVLEGGSIESDGMGTLLTTSECLLSPQRNGRLNQVEIEEYLKSTFHLQKVLWLDHGYLAGDDTDSHIDTLAQFLFYRHHCLRKMRRQRRRTLPSITRNGGTTENIPHLSRRTLSPVSLTDGGQDRRRRRTPARNLRQLPDYERSYSLPDIPSASE